MISCVLGEANFIDYEYGCYAFRGFDIGNHFNEFAGFECEYWRYPTKELQMKWYDWYLTENNNGGKVGKCRYVCKVLLNLIFICSQAN